MYDILSLGEMVLPELRKVADKYEVSHKGLKKQDLIYKILDFQAVNPEKFKDVKPASSEKTEAKKPAPIKKNNYIDKTVEEIKDRYFTVSKLILEARG